MARWAKMHSPSSTALAELLAMSEVHEQLFVHLLITQVYA